MNKNVFKLKKYTIATECLFFHHAIVPVLQRNTHCFIVQNRLFYNAKQWVLYYIDNQVNR